MERTELFEKIRRDYGTLGYLVITHPDQDYLPEGLKNLGIDMVAEGKGERVAIQVKRREDLIDLDQVKQVEERLKGQPGGWRLDLIVVPADPEIVITRAGTEAGIPYILSLMQEANAALAADLLRAAFVMAWAAAEAAMREAARKNGIPIDREVPRFVLKSLYSGGVISHEDYELAEKSYETRSAVVHGFRPSNLEKTDVESLVAFLKRLLEDEQESNGDDSSVEAGTAREESTGSPP